MIKDFSIILYGLPAYDESKACVKLYLNSNQKKMEGILLLYDLQHIILANTKPPPERLNFEDRVNNDLVKIKKMTKGLHYEIRVVPNTF